MLRRLKEVILIFSVLLAMQPVTTIANAESDLLDFNIASQDIGTALKEFSNISDYQFMYTDLGVAQRKTDGIKGKLSVDKALLQLFDGTNIEYEYINQNTIRLFLPKTEASSSISKKVGDNMLAEANSSGSAPIVIAQASSADSASSSSPSRTSQAEKPSNVLEEVTVTARKREESLQDVPISISAFDGGAMRSNGVTGLETLSATVPNFFIAESFIGDAMFVRGVGSGQNNFGVEQAVGQVLDGVFYGRSRFSRLSFLDVQRVEVLKGPQGALIGKNTTAGAVNITTNQPTDTFEASISPTYEVLADDGFSIEGVVSGPLTEQLKARVAVLYEDRDGYIDNTETGAEQISREDIFARGTLLWEPSDNFDATLTYQYGDMERKGENSQYSTCNFTAPQLPPLGLNLTRILNIGSSEDCKANFKRAGAAPRASFGQADASGKDTSFDTVGLVMNWEVANHTITSVTGWAQYDYRDIQDSDRSRVENLSVDFGEDYEQWSQELRIASPQDKRFDYIVGLYYQSKEQHSDYGIDIGAFQARRNTVTDEDGETIALFGQLTWHFNEEWDLTVGGRYTHEEKEARSQGFPSLIYDTTTRINTPVGAAGLNRVHDVTDKLTENNFSPNVNLQWRPDDASMYYVSFSRGFKAGAFNHALVATQANALDPFRVDAEDVSSYEIGTKLTLLDGAAQFSAAFFYSEFSDLQQTVLRGADIINDVLNVGDSTSQGVEVDLRWRATDNLVLTGSIAYLDSEFDEFPNATCYALQSPTECVAGQQDLAGRPFQFAADWRGSFSGEYTWRLQNGYQIVGFLQTYFSSDYFLQQDLDPNLVQDDYIKVDGRLTLNSPDDRWEISLVARNLGNVITANYGDDIPLQTGSVWKSVDAPRSFSIQGVWRFF